MTSPLEAIAADGVVLRGEADGPTDGPVVLLLHGGGQTRHAWAAERRLLAADGYRAIAFDLRGHGDSDWSSAGDYSIDAHAGDLAAIAARLAAPLIVVGASLGGLAGIYAIGSGCGDGVRALILVDIAPRVVASGSNRIQSFMRAHLNGFDSVDEAAAAVARYSTNRTKPVNLEGLRRNLRERDGRLFWHWDPRILERTATFDPIGIVDDAMTVAAAVEIPTLLVHGGRSDIVDADSVAALTALIPHAEVAEVPAAGHMVAGDDNSTFHAGIKPFLDRQFSVAGASAAT